MKNVITIIFLAASLISSGCSIKHYIARDYPQYLKNNSGSVAYGNYSAARNYYLTSATKSYSYEFRAMTTGYANLWIVEIGSMLDATMQSDDIQTAFSGISKASNLVESGAPTLVFDLVHYEFTNYAASISLRARLQRGEHVLFEKLYQNAGRGQAGKMFWGGAFAQKNAVQQSTKFAIDAALKELIKDLQNLDKGASSTLSRPM